MTNEELLEIYNLAKDNKVLYMGGGKSVPDMYLSLDELIKLVKLVK